MQKNEIRATEEPMIRPRPRQIASWGRLVGFLLIVAGMVAVGIFVQHATTAGGGAATGQSVRHSRIPLYLNMILLEWALLYFCWRGVRGYGGNLETLSGGRWSCWKDVAVDLAIALPFWVLWQGAMYGVSRLVGANFTQSAIVLPQSLLEILTWIAASISAGVCEEMAFRGFLQPQLHALSGSIVIAVLVQGAVFGIGHAYQGWKNVIVISVLGVLFGALAAWRGNLRANIIVHAWADVWLGWLRFVVWR
jgi:membrane protease YdiL (CAAX protease family)